MKKCVLLWIFLLLIIPFSVEAKVTTYPRTKENLLVPNDIVVSQDMEETILKTPAVDSSLKLYDFAEVFSFEEEEKLLKTIKDYVKTSETDAVIVVTNDLLGFNIMQYASAFYDYNSFKKNGLIFVLYLGEEEPTVYMAGNGGNDTFISQVYSKRMIQDILKYIYPDIKNKRYYTAFDNYMTILQGIYNIQQKNRVYRVTEDGTIIKVIPWGEIFILGVALTFIVDILFVYHLRGVQSVEKEDLSQKIDEENMIVKLEKDELIDTSK